MSVFKDVLLILEGKDVNRLKAIPKNVPDANHNIVDANDNIVDANHNIVEMTGVDKGSELYSIHVVDGKYAEHLIQYIDVWMQECRKCIFVILQEKPFCVKFSYVF